MIFLLYLRQLESIIKRRINRAERMIRFMDRIADFNADIKKGEEGEKIFLKHMQRYARQQKIKIEDVSKEKEFQLMDIDFLLIDNDKKYALEFKTDSYKSGNMFYEEYSCLETKSAGCMQKTKANVILYYFSNMDVLYTIYNVNAFRDWYFERADRFRHCSIKNKLGRDKTYNAWGGLIPLKELEADMERLNFARKTKLNGASPSDILDSIKLSVAFRKNENIATSLKTTYRRGYRERVFRDEKKED